MNIGENWPSCYNHAQHKCMLVRYVDDFKISGPAAGVKKCWELLRTVIKRGPEEPAGLFLGCIHEDVNITLPDGTIARGKSYNSEALLRDCVSSYKELAIGLTGHEPKIQHAETPAIAEDVKGNCPASVPIGSGGSLQCRYVMVSFLKTNTNG